MADDWYRSWRHEQRRAPIIDHRFKTGFWVVLCLLTLAAAIVPSVMDLLRR